MSSALLLLERSWWPPPPPLRRCLEPFVTCPLPRGPPNGASRQRSFFVFGVVRHFLRIVSPSLWTILRAVRFPHRIVAGATRRRMRAHARAYRFPYPAVACIRETEARPCPPFAYAENAPPVRALPLDCRAYRSVSERPTRITTLVNRRDHTVRIKNLLSGPSRRPRGLLGNESPFSARPSEGDSRRLLGRGR